MKKILLKLQIQLVVVHYVLNTSNLKMGNTIELDFLGKDSIAYHNEVSIAEQPFKNLQSFCRNKSGSQDIFDTLNPSKLNDHLKELMPGLSAKVFRTYNASITLETQLNDPNRVCDPNWTDIQKLQFYNEANRKVAILCNHQKSVSKGHGAAMTSLGEKLKEMEDHRDALLNKKVDEFNGKKLPTDMEKRKQQAAKLEDRIKQQMARIALKEDNKTVSLGTSKINYMDPRVTVSWCKRVQLPIEKVFNRSLLNKFPWAFETTKTWRFTDAGDI
eukprot:UN04798